jgi:hypothetical protein
VSNNNNTKKRSKRGAEGQKKERKKGRTADARANKQQNKRNQPPFSSSSVLFCCPLFGFALFTILQRTAFAEKKKMHLPVRCALLHLERKILMYTASLLWERKRRRVECMLLTCAHTSWACRRACTSACTRVAPAEQAPVCAQGRFMLSESPGTRSRRRAPAASLCLRRTSSYPA